MAFMDAAQTLHLVNLTTGEEMEALANPSQFSESVAVNYSDSAVPGLSHPVTQYQSTGARTLSGIELYLSRFNHDEIGSVSMVEEWKRFLRSLTVPPQGAKGVAATRPARCLFVWPNVLTMTCVVTALEFRYQHFGTSGQDRVTMAVVSLREIRDERVTAEDYRGGGV